MLGFRFTEYLPPDKNGNTFDLLLNVFMQLINITSGNVAETLELLNQLDRKYKLTSDNYAVGDFINDLKEQGWLTELAVISSLGKFDAVLKSENKIVVAEWETGNVSSSHRSLNKMAFAIQQQLIIAGFLIVPCRNLAKYLTDRIGNYEELEPYFNFWLNSIASYPGVLLILGIEQDVISFDVPKIPKGTDGRAKN